MSILDGPSTNEPEIQFLAWLPQHSQFDNLMEAIQYLGEIQCLDELRKVERNYFKVSMEICNTTGLMNLILEALCQFDNVQWLDSQSQAPLDEIQCLDVLAEIQ